MNRYLTLALAAGLIASAAAAARPHKIEPHWVASWATSEQIPKPADVLPADVLTNATLRQVVHLSIGGTALRLTISNVFGTTPLHLTAVHIATPAGRGVIDPATDHALTFNGHDDVIIPPGAAYVSDPLAMKVAPFSDLAISIHYDNPPSPETAHPGSRATSFIVPGDHVSDASLPDAKLFDHWFQIASIEVAAAPQAAAVVALGDSITDGHGSTTNGNDRWTDALARQLTQNPATRNLSVLNAGLGGNRILADDVTGGPSALSRLDRDVFSAVGARYLIVFEGINDLGVLTRDQAVPDTAHQALVEQMIAAYKQIALQAHSHGIKVFCATIMPDGGNDYYHPDATNNADRGEVNAWLRVQHECDGVIDFDAALRDPAHPEQLAPAYDTGDHLHSSPAGYRLMGELAARAIAAPARPVKHRRHK